MNTPIIIMSIPTLFGKYFVQYCTYSALGNTENPDTRKTITQK